MGASNADQAKSIYRAIRAHDHVKLGHLLRSGASASGTYHGQPFVVSAAAAQDERALGMLLKRGANPNVTSKSGISSLESAAFHDSVSMVRLLLSAGASARLHNRLGGTPLSLARSVAVARLLLARGADINSRVTDGQTVLHAWSCYANPKLVGFGLRHGAMVEAVDVHGDTPLLALTDQAWRDKDDSDLRYKVLRHDPKPERSEKWFARDAQRRWEQDLKVARVLLAWGAEPKRKNEYGESPISWARKHGLTGFVNLYSKPRS